MQFLHNEPFLRNLQCIHAVTNLPHSHSIHFWKFLRKIIGAEQNTNSYAAPKPDVNTSYLLHESLSHKNLNTDHSILHQHLRQTAINNYINKIKIKHTHAYLCFMYDMASDDRRHFSLVDISTAGNRRASAAAAYSILGRSYTLDRIPTLYSRRSNVVAACAARGLLKAVPVERLFQGYCTAFQG